MKNNIIVTIAGNRPEVIKLSGIIDKLGTQENHTFLYTGQHFSSNMKDIFFDELKVSPDIDLKLNTSDTQKLYHGILKILHRLKPSYTIVYGDTNTTVAGCMAARQIPDCKLIHIEAGLRSFDYQMQEERNRIYVDSFSDYLLTPTNLSQVFLKYEGHEKNVFVTGNPIVDVCEKLYPVAKFKNSISLPKDFVLLTLHRAENVDNYKILKKLIRYLKQVKYPIIFPVHPRTIKNIQKYNITLPSNVIIIKPLGYMDFLGLLKECKIVLTDSGGLQEESVITQKPCITLRNTTERWETILMKANRLFPLHSTKSENLQHVIDEMIDIEIKHHPFGKDVENCIVEFIKELKNSEQLSKLQENLNSKSETGDLKNSLK